MYSQSVSQLFYNIYTEITLSFKESKAGGPCLYRLKGAELSKSIITHETVQYCFVLHYTLNRTVFVTHTLYYIHSMNCYIFRIQAKQRLRFKYHFFGVFFHFCSTYYIDKNINFKLFYIFIRASDCFAWSKKVSLFLISTVWLFDACSMLSDPWLNSTLLHEFALISMFKQMH